MSTSTARHWTVPRIVTTVVAVVTVFGALIADLVSPGGSAQHIFNDNWPPHAKFHDAQYIVMSILLGGIALALLVRRRGDTGAQLLWACAILATPWLGMFGALLFPGTAAQDPQFEQVHALGLHPQILLAIILVALLAVAAVVERTRSTPRPQSAHQ